MVSPIPVAAPINPIFIIILRPSSGAIWAKTRRSRTLDAAGKFAWALLGISISFLIHDHPGDERGTGAEVVSLRLVGGCT